nr:RecName: Full=Peroxidase 8 [Daucus carota]
NAPPNLTLR